MSVHEASEFWRVLRAQRCRCGEFPQAHYHTGRGAIWFACTCGKVSKEAQDIERAIVRWNELNTWGETT